MVKHKKQFKYKIGLNKYSDGLTLVETIVAISILIMAVVGPLVIYSNSIRDARYASDQVTAYLLAQDALEEAKRKIYSNMNGGLNNITEWLYFSTGGVGGGTIDGKSCNGSNNPCIIDAPHVLLCMVNTTNCGSFPGHLPGKSVLSDAKITVGTTVASLEYSHYPSFQDTIFSRTIEIESPYAGNADEALLTVRVEWTRFGVTKNIEVKTDVFRWKR